MNDAPIAALLPQAGRPPRELRIILLSSVTPVGLNYPTYYCGFFAASASSARAPARIEGKSLFPSWQAYSKSGWLLFVQGISAVQGLSQVFGSSTVNR